MRLPGGSLGLILTWMIVHPAAAQIAGTGPETEKKFPPLTVPAGFHVTLFACDPLVEYPSVIAVGPRPRTMFVAHDYLTGLGTEIIRRDEIRLLEDTDDDGYADKSTLFAGEFNSLQGLAFHAGTVFAMHAPFLTALRDTNGDGIADERRDLLTGLGLTPEQNQTRLHCANGVTVGHDGWLYLALGDNGVDVLRPEGDRLVLNGGGILRCRLDGHDLHVFSMGLRNIYDIALDERINVFVRDNENDGGDYMIRVCHSFYGADHGYPYLYRDHPDEALAPMADLGRGSSAGGVCYLETAFPAEYRGNLFFCEWGRAVVRYERNAAGSGFAATKEIDFAAGAATDPYGFKPTDLIVDRDGSLLISDWGDGQRPKRGRGRIYRIHSREKLETPRTPEVAVVSLGEATRQLNEPRYFRRVDAQGMIESAGQEGLKELKQALRERSLNPTARCHAVWIMAAVDGRAALDELFEMAARDDSSSVRAQAIRAIGDLTDPVFERKSLAAGRGDSAIAERLTRLPETDDALIRREISIVLGRLRWSGSVNWLSASRTVLDQTLAHVIQQTFRSSDNWPEVLKLLDGPDDLPVRSSALGALAERADAIIVDGLIERLQRSTSSTSRLQYAMLLSRVFKKPGPWVYWGYRPAPRPENTVTWDRTEAIGQVLNLMLTDSDRDVRVAVLRQMQREKIPVQRALLAQWLNEERVSKRVDAILDGLALLPAAEIRAVLCWLIQGREYPEENRQRALAMITISLGEQEAALLLDLATKIEDGPLLSQMLLELGKYPSLSSQSLLLAKLESIEAQVRASALTSLSRLYADLARAKVVGLLSDQSILVRRVAAEAAGRLKIREAAERLSVLAGDDDPMTCSASLDSLRLLGNQSAVVAAAAALRRPESQLAGLNYLTEFGTRNQAQDVESVAATSRSVEILSAAVRALGTWSDSASADSRERQGLETAIAKIHGDSGVLLHWRATGPLAADSINQTRERLERRSDDMTLTSVMASGVESRVDLDSKQAPEANGIWLLVSDVLVSEATRAQFLASSSGTLHVWLNGKSIHESARRGSFQSDSDRFEGELSKGRNQIIVQVSGPPKVRFHVRFRRLGSSAEHERLTQFALQNAGSADRGRELFFNQEKSICLRCHRLVEQGGRIGPDLTAIGSRFSRMHLIESILEPSRTIAPSYETITVLLASGLVVSGVKVSESEVALVLGDEQGKLHEIPKGEIDERVRQPRSTMPDGLEKRMTDREFLDLVTFLVSQRKSEEQ